MNNLSQVNEYVIQNTKINFKGGKVKTSLQSWKALTSDNTILGYVKGVQVPLEFDFEDLPLDRKQINFSREEKIKAKKLIDDFLKAGVVETVSLPDNGVSVTSNFFLREKSDGRSRFILNLKPFNGLIQKTKFKLTTLRSALKLVKKNCFFGKMDFKDGYFSINIDEASRRFFRFDFEGQKFQFCCLPQGYRDAVRIFTKIMKPPLAFLRGRGHINVGYIDDTLFIGYAIGDCKTNIQDSIILFDGLGFTINLDKSVFTPTQIIEFLGFIINSIEMNVKPTEKRAQNMRKVCTEILGKEEVLIRDLARVIGKMVSMTEGNVYAPLFFKRLEILRNEGLKQSKGNYDYKITLNTECISDIKWWIENVDKFPKPIHLPPFTTEMYSDASGSGFGISCEGQKTQGLWNKNEQDLHINAQELLAIKIGIFAFFKDRYGEHIHVFTDSSVAVSCITKFGSCKPKLNHITRDIWLHCFQRKNFITASHIAGKHNVIADKLSREHKVELEWKLNPNTFSLLSSVLGPFDVDLFASRVNFQFKPYISWNPDPDAIFINAFHLNWGSLYGYCFPPFSLVPQVLQKIQEDQCEICLIVPFWKNQTYFPVLGRLLIDFPLLLPQKKNLLLHPFDNSSHPIIYRLHLTACRLSGNLSKGLEFRKKVRKLSLLDGGLAPSSNIRPIRGNGFNFVVEGGLIPVLQLLEK